MKPQGKAVICKDDPYLLEMMPNIQSEVITYGIDSEADVVARNIDLGDRKVSFDVVRGGRTLGTIRLSVPGKHNVYNALATLITCMEAGLSFEQVAEAIPSFRGAKRRFQVLGEVNDMLVIDDYAHHPTEIEATIQAAKATGKRIVAVFQPQRYTRTYFLFEQFSRSFPEADEVIITDIYSPAGEKQIEGITSAKLVELIKQNSNRNVRYIPTKEEVQAYLSRAVQPGDLVLTMGAGDIWKAAAGLAKALEERQSS